MYVVFPMTPIIEKIWSFQFCSSEHPVQTELKHFPRRGRWCANGHWHTRSYKIWVSSWVSWCLSALWTFSTLHGRPWCTVVGRWGSARISTISFLELNPSEAERAKSNRCRHFAEWGQFSRGKSRALRSVHLPRPPANPAPALASCASLWHLELPFIWFQQSQHLLNHLWITWHLHRLVENTKVICQTTMFPAFLSFLPSWACCFSQLKLYEHGRGEEIGYRWWKITVGPPHRFSCKNEDFLCDVSLNAVINSTSPHWLQSEIRTHSTTQVCLLRDTITQGIKITCILSS